MVSQEKNPNALKNPSAWRGVWTALITPLKNDAGRLALDVESLRKLIDSQINNGIRGLVIAGSTGEGSLLAADVYEDLLKTSKQIVGSRIPLVAGLGIGGTDACLKNLALAKSLEFDGVLASPPAYVKAPQRGLVEHYLRLGREGVPVCVYEVGSRAASSIEVGTLAEICAANDEGAEWIVATKDASANMERALETSRRLGDRVALLSGDDFTWAPFLACGGDGIISVVSHIAPRAMGLIQKLFQNGKTHEACVEQNRLTPLVDGMFWESNPIPVKNLVYALGLISHLEMVKPLVAMDIAKLEKLKRVAAEIRDAS